MHRCESLSAPSNGGRRLYHFSKVTHCEDYVTSSADTVAGCRACGRGQCVQWYHSQFHSVDTHSLPTASQTLFITLDKKSRLTVLDLFLTLWRRINTTRVSDHRSAASLFTSCDFSLFQLGGALAPSSTCQSPFKQNNSIIRGDIPAGRRGAVKLLWTGRPS